jgi:hypothetical protein
MNEDVMFATAHLAITQEDNHRLAQLVRFLSALEFAHLYADLRRQGFTQAAHAIMDARWYVSTV